MNRSTFVGREVRYLESLTDCSTITQIQKLRHVDLGAENRELSADEKFIQARNEYESFESDPAVLFPASTGSRG